MIGQGPFGNAYTIGGPQPLTFDADAGLPDITLTSDSVGAYLSAPLVLSKDLNVLNNSSKLLTLANAISGPSTLQIRKGAVMLKQDALYPSAHFNPGGGIFVYQGASLSPAGTANSTAPVHLVGGTIAGGTTASASLNCDLSVDQPSQITNGCSISGSISGSADLALHPNTYNITLSSASNLSNFTGTIHVEGDLGGKVSVTSANALGPTSGTCVVDYGGYLSLGAATLKPINVLGGTVDLGSGNFSTPITLTGGTLTGLGTLAAPLTLVSSYRPSSIWSSAAVTHVGDINGSGTLLLYNASIGGVIRSTGDILVRSCSIDNSADQPGSFRTTFQTGQLNVRAPVAFTGTVSLTSYTSYSLYLFANTSIRNLVVDSATIGFTNGATLAITDSLELRSGTSSWSFSGTPTITKTTEADATFALPAACASPVIVNRGRLITSSLGSATGSATVAASTGAVLDVRANTADSIYLANAAGIDIGALVVDLDGTSSTLSGPIDLGTQGSAIGVSATAQMTLSGGISGGALTLNRRYATTNTGKVNVTAATAFTGRTMLADNASLSISSAGTLGATSDIRLVGRSVLAIDNSTLPATDRLPDSAPIVFSGGALQYRASGSESAGGLTINAGHADLSLLATTTTPSIALSFGGLESTAGGVLHLTATSSAGADVSPQIGTGATPPFAVALRTAPTLIHGLVPGVLVGDQFATYGANGLNQSLPDTTDITTAGPAANVGITGGASLTKNTVINSLVFNGSGGLTFSNNPVLTVNSGQVLVRRSTPATAAVASIPSGAPQGTIVPGDDSGGQLIFSGVNVLAAGATANTLNLACAIADRSPTQPTTVTLDSGTFNLSGTDTYTGDTYLNNTTTTFNGSSLPNGGSLYITGGTTNFLLSASPSLKTLSVRANGLIASVNSLPVAAQTYLFEGGTIQTKLLTGTGQFIKDGPHTLVIGTYQPAFSGSVDIRQGIVDCNGVGNSRALGSGPIRVGAGAQLLNMTFDTQPLSIQLDGGYLTGFGSVSGVPTGSLDVTSNSSIRLFSGGVNLNVHPGTTLTLISTTLSNSVVNLDGTITSSSAGSLQLRSLTGSGRCDLGLTFASGSTLSPGHSPGTVSAPSAEFDGGFTYYWDINDANPIPGVSSDLLLLDGVLTLASSKITLHIASLQPDNTPGALADWDPDLSYTWPLVSANSVSGYTSTLFNVDLTAFSPYNTVDGSFAVATRSGDLVLAYSPNNPAAVPEPAGLLVLSAGALLLTRRRQPRMPNRSSAV